MSNLPLNFYVSDYTIALACSLWTEFFCKYYFSTLDLSELYLSTLYSIKEEIKESENSEIHQNFHKKEPEI